MTSVWICATWRLGGKLLTTCIQLVSKLLTGTYNLLTTCLRLAYNLLTACLRFTAVSIFWLTVFRFLLMECSALSIYAYGIFCLRHFCLINNCIKRFLLKVSEASCRASCLARLSDKLAMPGALFPAGRRVCDIPLNTISVKYQ